MTAKWAKTDNLLEMEDTIALPNELSKHHQLPGNFCAASGFECIAKLHHLIPKDQFPLQSDDTNEGLGFGKDDTKFLNQWFDCRDSFFDAEAAISLIEKETHDGRFPLISLFEWERNKPIGWHVYLFLRYQEKLLLVDPRVVEVVTSDLPRLKALLGLNILTNPEKRQKLHVFWYQTKGKP